MKIMRLRVWRPPLLLRSTGARSAQRTLRIGLAEDPDVLDPTLARTYVGRIVFAALCDKLFDIDEKLNSCRSSRSRTRRPPTARPSPSSCARA